LGSVSESKHSEFGNAWTNLIDIFRPDRAQWNISGQTIYTFKGHTGAIKCLDVHNNEQIFVTSSKDNLIKIWNVDNSQCLRTYTGHRGVVTGLEFLDSGNIIASSDGVIQVWDPEKNVRLTQLDTDNTVLVMQCIDKGGTEFFAATEGTLCLMDAMKATVALHEWNLPSLLGNGIVRCICSSPKRSWIAIGCSTGLIILLDYRTGYILNQWKAHDSAITKLEALSRNKILSCSADKLIFVWDISHATPTLEKTFKGHTDAVCGFGFNKKDLISASGHKIAVAPIDDIENVVTITTVRVGHSSKNHFTTLNILPIHQLLLTGCENGDIKCIN